MPNRLILRIRSSRDIPDLIELARSSVSLHRPWIHLPLTRAAWMRNLEPHRQRGKIPYVLRLRGTHELVGVVSMSEIVRGVFKSAYLSYYVHARHARRGLMKEGVSRVVSLAFRKHGLHRLEANIQPGNTASRRLVKSLGFVREGFSRNYLKVDGRWQDHERWAATSETWGRE